MKIAFINHRCILMTAGAAYTRQTSSNRNYIYIYIYMKTQPVPRSKHSVSVIKTSQLMLFSEIIAVCSEVHTKHINTLCGQNVAL